MAKKADDSTPGAVQVETARRVLRAHGVDDAAFVEAAKTTKREQAALAAEDKQARGIPADATPAEVWLIGSMAQLRRWWGGRCLTCQHWTLGANDTGTCDTLNLTDPATAATFGCLLWAELPEDDDTLRTRTELAMALGLLPTMPEGA